jgi:hypothetical protein
MAGNIQNKGHSPKKMKQSPGGGGNKLEPASGDSAVEFRGTFVHADQQAGITRPAKGHMGSHDSKIREHAEHED